MTDATIDEGDAVTVYNRPATVERTLPGESTRVRFGDNGGLAWPDNEDVTLREGSA